MIPTLAQIELAVPAELEGLLAFFALLVAFAVRRRKRALSPVGFILFSLGLISDALIRSVPRGEWTRWGHALALTLIFWAAVQILIEGTQRTLVRGRAHFSTATVDILRAILYLTVPILILRLELHLDFRMLGVLSTVPAGGALVGWLLRSEFLRTLVLQSQKSAKPGDWVRFDDKIGRIQWTGWRATRILTTGNESLHIPNSVLSQRPLLNFSTGEMVEDQVQIELGSFQPPWKVEEIVLGLLRDSPEILSDPPPTIELSGFRGDDVQYRIRYWLDDYAHQTGVRSRLLRSIWYAARRNSLRISTDHFPDPTATSDGVYPSERMLAALRRSYLLSGLNEEELALLMPATRIVEFAAGDVIIHDGEIGTTFYILLRGQVDVLERDGSGRLVSIRKTDDHSQFNFFGEIALLTGEPRTATIRALTDLELLEVNRDGFARLFQAKPDTAKTIADVASERLRETSDRSLRPSQRPGQSARGWLLSMMRELFDLQ